MAAGVSGRITALALVQGRFCSAQVPPDAVHLGGYGNIHWDAMNEVHGSTSRAVNDCCIQIFVSNHHPACSSFGTS